MIPAMKVPALSLTLAFALAACGAEPESAADLESAPYEEETSVEAPPAAPAPDAQAPPATSPATPPATGRQAPPPPPVQDDRQPLTEPPAEEAPPVSDPTEGEWEQLEEPMNALPVGTMMTARLNNVISTRTHAEGDRFTAVVVDALRGGEGQILVPAGTEVRGHVATARASSDSREESVLVLAFDALVLDGRELPFRATVLDANVSGAAGASGARSAGTVATGAAAGAILGQILGRDTRSTVAGAAVGAVAGAGIAMTTRDGHAEVPEGTTLRLQLDEPLAVVAGGR